MQPVRFGGAGDHEFLAGVDQDLQIFVGSLTACRRQVGVTGRDPGNCQRVGRVGLARSAQPGPLPAGHLGRDLADISMMLPQEAAEPSAEVGRALDADPARSSAAAAPGRPGEQGPVTGLVIIEYPLIHEPASDINTRLAGWLDNRTPAIIADISLVGLSDVVCQVGLT